MNCLTRLLPGDLSIVVAEAGHPFVQEIVGPIHFVSLGSNEIGLDFSNLPATRGMVVARWILLHLFHDLFLLFRAEWLLFFILGGGLAMRAV